MATENANGYYYNGDIAVGDESYGVRYGVKILKKVYLDETSDNRWIVQNGEVKDNKFVAFSDGKDLSLYSTADLERSYKLLWTKDPEPVFKKGDILEGTDKEGKRVVFLFETESVVHRLTPYNGSFTNVSWASLAQYKRELKADSLKIVNSRVTGVPFSKI